MMSESPDPKPIFPTVTARFIPRTRLETRLSAWSDSIAVMEQTFVVASGPRRGRVAARALVKAGFYDRAKRTQVPVRRLVAELGLTEAETASPPMTPEIAAFLAADASLRQHGGAREKPAPVS